MVAHAFNSNRQRQVELCEFKPSLVCIVTSRPQRATLSDPVSNDKQRREYKEEMSRRKEKERGEGGKEGERKNRKEKRRKKQQTFDYSNCSMSSDFFSTELLQSDLTFCFFFP